MYTIEFPSGGYKMVQRESIELSHATYRFTMDRKTPDLPSIETSSRKTNIFATTHEDHLHPQFTGQWYSSSSWPVSAYQSHAHSRAVVLHTLYIGLKYTIICPYLVMCTMLYPSIAPTYYSSPRESTPLPVSLQVTSQYPLIMPLEKRPDPPPPPFPARSCSILPSHTL